jgi:hypothetical protein
MRKPLLVDTVGVQLAANRWDVSACELNGATVPAELRFSYQTNVVAVHSAHSDVAAVVSALRGRIRPWAANALESNAHFIAGEAGSASQLNTVLARLTEV